MVSQDGKKLFTNTFTFGQGITKGPGRITVQPITGGSLQNIYSNPDFAITQMQVTADSLLFVMGNNDTYSGSSIDTSQNGLWKMNLNGSGLTRLITMNRGDGGSLEGTTPWSSISRNGNMYALEFFIASNNTSSLVFGSPGGSTPTTFASTLSLPTSELQIVGWTTM
jgi:eukaryotic-like serine/threonine-protein kinase